MLYVFVTKFHIYWLDFPNSSLMIFLTVIETDGVNANSVAIETWLNCRVDDSAVSICKLPDFLSKMSEINRWFYQNLVWTLTHTLSLVLPPMIIVSEPMEREPWPYLPSFKLPRWCQLLSLNSATMSFVYSPPMMYAAFEVEAAEYLLIYHKEKRWSYCLIVNAINFSLQSLTSSQTDSPHSQSISTLSYP